MMQYTKFDQRKPFTLIEVKELLDESFELKERKRKSKFKKHRHSKQRKNK
jgi:hypothetical protein